MSLHLLIAGALAADPVARTGASGKPFTTASMRVPRENGEAIFASLIAFGQMAQSLLALGKGDALAVSGRGDLTTYTGRDGEERHGLSCVAEAVLTPYQLARRREKVRGATEPSSEVS